MLQSRSNVPLADYISPDDFKCYNLPIGVIGVVSHVLTYWTVVCLWYGRRPLWPYHELVLRMPDLVANTAGFFLCIAISAITLNNCKETWEFMVIAVWKLSTSVLNALILLG